MSAAVKVGIFVCAAGAMAIYGAQFLGFAPQSETVSYRAAFKDAAGLSRGSKVTLSGVEVGRVEEVGLASNGKAFAVMQLRKDVTLLKGVKAVIPTSMVSIGVTELRLVQPENSTTPHDRNNEIPGSIQNPFTDLLPDMDTTMTEVNKTLIAVQKVLDDQELRTAVVGTLKQTQATAKDFGMLANRMDGVLKRNEGQIALAMKTANSALTDLQGMTSEIKKLVASGELQDSAKNLLASMESAVKKAELLVSDVQKLTSDPQLSADLKATLESIRIASESGPVIAANAEAMSANGVVVSEQTVALLNRVNSMAGQIEKLIDKFNGAIDGIAGVAGAGSRGLFPDVGLEADVTHDTRSGRIRSDVTATIPAGKETVRIGLYDAFESNKVIAQLQRPFGPSTDLRYGIYAGRPGIGVDYRANDRFGVTGNLFGLNNTQLDLRLRYDLGRGILGYAGVDRLFQKNSFAVGVGIRR